jgi:hypothetical protein
MDKSGIIEGKHAVDYSNAPSKSCVNNTSVLAIFLFRVNA